MAVLNDFGPEAYARANQQITDFANRLGIQREVIVQYVNDTAHLPQTLQELERWGDTPDPIYGQRRRQPNGVWTPLATGPTPGLTDQQRAGFPGHFITNEVGQLERFLNVDPSGNIWGGSWDPAYNQAHPGGSPAIPAATGPRTAQGGTLPSGNTLFSAQSNPYAPGMPQADPALAATWDAANPSSAGTPTPTASGSSVPSSGGSVPTSSGGGATPGGASGVGANPSDLTAAISLANNAAQQEYLRKRLELDRDIALMGNEREKERIALEAARDAWNKTYQTASLSGYMPGSGVAGKGQAIDAAVKGLASNPQYQQADLATRMQMEAAAVSQATGMDSASALAGIQRLRQLTATTGQMSSPALIEQVFGQTAGGAGTPTLDREKEQNQSAIQALTLLSQFQGPENAFTYARALANLPPSIRANIEASMARLPFTGLNPAQRGVLGDVGVGTAVSGQNQGVGAGTAVGGRTGAESAALPPNVAASGSIGVPAATGPRTAQQQALQFLPAPQAAGVQPAGTTGPTPTGQVVGGEPTPAELAAARAAGAVYQAASLQPDIAYGPRTQPTTAGAGTGEPFNPGQLSPTDINRTDPYAQKVMWAGFRDAGGDIDSGKWRFAQSLPRAVGPRSGTYRAA